MDCHHEPECSIVDLRTNRVLFRICLECAGRWQSKTRSKHRVVQLLLKEEECTVG